MRINLFLFLPFLFSCNSPSREEKIIPNSTSENPWIYINRVSDTLPETEFSLNKSIDENREILTKYNQPFYDFKYRIGQNQYLKVQARNIISDGGIYCFFPPFPYEIMINLNDEIYLANSNIQLSISKIDTLKILYQNFISENKKEGHIPNSSLFTISSEKHVNQNSIQKIISILAEGYIELLKKHYKNFEELKESQQDSIIALQPFIMIYHFHDEPPIRGKK